MRETSTGEEQRKLAAKQANQQAEGHAAQVGIQWLARLANAAQEDQQRDAQVGEQTEDAISASMLM